MKPEDVVRDATSPKSPLHRCFEWDDKKAAHEQRLARARELIGMVYYEHETRTVTVMSVGYVRDPDVPGNQQGYVSVQAAREDPALARRALAQEVERCAGYLERARRLAASLDLEAELDDLLLKLLGVQQLKTVAA